MSRLEWTGEINQVGQKIRNYWRTILPFPLSRTSKVKERTKEVCMHESALKTQSRLQRFLAEQRIRKIHKFELVKWAHIEWEDRLTYLNTAMKMAWLFGARFSRISLPCPIQQSQYAQWTFPLLFHTKIAWLKISIKSHYLCIPWIMFIYLFFLINNRQTTGQTVHNDDILDHRKNKINHPTTTIPFMPFLLHFSRCHPNHSSLSHHSNDTISIQVRF